jgi:GT2 family glycosyltransferase
LTPLTAIVVNRDRVALLRDAVRSVERAISGCDVHGDVIVVDNGSSDGSREMIRAEFPEARLIAWPENRGFAAAVNAAIAASDGDWLLLVNNDAVIAEDALGVALGAKPSEDVGTIALEMRFAERPDLINSTGIGIDVLGVAFDRLLGTPVGGPARRPTEVFGASAGAALYRRAMLEDIGGFDDRFFMYLEDADVAWRARMAGWRSTYTPGAVVWHRHSATARHGSPFKLFHVGRNRVRLLARNADGRHLLRHAVRIVAYDLAYVAFVALSDRTLAPARGRLAGLREWRSLRAEMAATRRPVPLERRAGMRAALRRRRAWREGASP